MGHANLSRGGQSTSAAGRDQWSISVPIVCDAAGCVPSKELNG